MKRLLLASAFVVVAGSAHAYTYVPTEEDRREITQCIVHATPHTELRDCILPTVSRITYGLYNLPKTWSISPSQLEVMLRKAMGRCGLPDSLAGSPPKFGSTDDLCIKGQLKLIIEAIVIALAQYAQDP